VAARLTLDLHPLFNRGQQIEAALDAAFAEAESTRASDLTIIPGKGSGQLKQRVIRYLDRPEVKARYHRREVLEGNSGRVVVHFRWRGLRDRRR